MAEISFWTFPLIIFLVLLNSFFVASEFAFVKIRMTRITELIEKGSRRAKRTAQIVGNLDRSLSSTQLGITLASIALGFVGEPFFTELLLIVAEIFNNLLNLGFTEQIETAMRDGSGFIHFIAFFMGYFIVTFFHVVIGELAPKSISIQFAETTALWCAEPLYWFMWITDPLLDFFVWTSNGLLRLLKVPPANEAHTQVFTEDELKLIIEDSIKKGEIEPYESRLIFNILDFTDSNVKSILTPRIDIEALPIDCEPDDILKLSIKTGFSRIPIFEENLDNIIGFVHVKDVLSYANGMIEEDEEFTIQNVLRPVIVVPEGKPLDDLLKEMQQLKTQVSVIVDEYGSVEGIATIEDVLEYIVGPIDDEFDEETPASISVEDGKIIAGGLISIESFNNTLNELYGIEIESEEAVTLAGYVLELFESEIPTEGMITTDDDLQYKIIKQTGNRLEEIEVLKI